MPAGFVLFSKFIFFWSFFPLSAAIFCAERRRRRIFTAVGAKKLNRQFGISQFLTSMEQQTIVIFAAQKIAAPLLNNKINDAFLVSISFGDIVYITVFI
ncbi:hypothetical protein [Flavobacterium sp.]|uniref:hypothetical protein n=1 Tax=Flavobacterium sp. TaxID=239 RepID=UPI0031D2F2F5